jgi:transaldolase/glucose-6-phosphate isomerase
MDTRLLLPSGLDETVRTLLDRAVEERWASRLHERDTSLWTQDEATAEAIAHRLGWLDAPSAFRDEAAELMAFGDRIEQEGFSDALVCGVGGASLAAEALSLAYGESDEGLRIRVLDSTDPAAIRACDAELDPERTLRVIATKSGTTTETLALLAHLHEAEQHRVGRFPRSKAGDHFVAITDPGPALESVPGADYFRETFLDPPDVSSRFSALTYVGLVPAALLRLDVEALLEDARLMADACRDDDADNPGLVLGVAMAALALAGRDKLTFVIEPDLAGLGPWMEMLVAGSTAWGGRGVVPIEGEVLGEVGTYGTDRVFVRLGSSGDSEWHAGVDARLAALADAGHPLIDIRLDEASWVGAEFFRWQFAAAVAGIALGVDPFDDPDVPASKRETEELLDALRREGHLPGGDPVATWGDLRFFVPVAPGGDLSSIRDGAAILSAHLARVPAGGYHHVGAFVAPSAERTAALRAIQSRLRDATGRATSVGYGPRFLHATGRLHTAGPATGCFLQLVAGHPDDLPVPGRGGSFGALIDAQAEADLGVLAQCGRPILRVHLGDDVDAGLADLRAALDQALARD